jgi:hypothetical protein
MKYGIKLKGKLTDGGFYSDPSVRSSISEYVSPKSVKTLEFNSIADAELYAQNHELKNYDIEVIL